MPRAETASLPGFGEVEATVGPDLRAALDALELRVVDGDRAAADRDPTEPRLLDDVAGGHAVDDPDETTGATARTAPTRRDRSAGPDPHPVAVGMTPSPRARMHERNGQALPVGTIGSR